MLSQSDRAQVRGHSDVLHMNFSWLWRVILDREKAMAPHSSTLAWKIPWAEEPGGLQSMELLGVWHDWATSLPLFTCMHWRRKWQPTPVFLPGESHGQRSLAGYSPWGRKESDMTEWLHTHIYIYPLPFGFPDFTHTYISIPSLLVFLTIQVTAVH